MLTVPSGHRPSVSSRFSLIAYDAQTLGVATVFRSAVWLRLSLLAWTSQLRATIQLQGYSSTPSSTERMNNKPVLDIRVSFAVAGDVGAPKDDDCGPF
ncbi:hypothetical protein GALMADRAFT_273900 [Galerina marginata CBS 339.88]|uniref:Uncharacterized protein n=1 Tax=Galerina marginata (strain CBS 339.88) TaxID=685588 RepID=A0A067S710_GALM3|nr:hypothetical protein GALMADRAFT_273900 [Galerina marginata CBS 339.88]